mgnify:CR=1 FL=1
MAVSRQGVPVVGSEEADGLVEALSGVGFAAVRDHHVPDADLAAMRRLLVALFDVDDGAKDRQSVSRDDYRGYIPLRFFSPNRDKAAPPDGFEGYKLHWECPPDHPVRSECALYGPNRWADHLPEMPSVVESWWAAMEAFASRLMAGLADAIGLQGKGFAEAMEAPLTNVTLLHYPGRRADDPAPGFHSHKDITVVTILDPDPVGGLEVRTRDGEWLEAVCPSDALLVNVGQKTEGVVPAREMRSMSPETIDELSVGDVIVVTVVRTETDEGQALLSVDRAKGEMGWRTLAKQAEDGTIIEAEVTGYNRGGAVAIALRATPRPPVDPSPGGAGRGSGAL